MSNDFSFTLNRPQHAAIRHTEGALLVLAGAGSGKTRVITEKVAHLVREAGFAAREIAAITFTNKAAQEMSRRVAGILETRERRGLTVSTFHALGLVILRAEHAAIGYKSRFSILDSSDAQKLVAELIQNPDRAEVRLALTQISRLKNDFISPEAALARAQSEGEARLARLYARYQESLHAYQSVDFDDLIRLPVELFQREAEVLTRWQLRLRYLLVDEYQDTNTCQYQLLRQLSALRQNFTVVGDDDQSIYAWRGANAANFSRLQEDFSQLHIIKLEQNYRSSMNILQAANAVIAHNAKAEKAPLFEKKLWSAHGPGDEVAVLEMGNEEHEAEAIAMRIEAHRFEQRGSYGDYAILYRSNHQARLIETQLRNLKIPYRLSGGQSFFEKSEIKDVLAYLRLIVNDDDDPAFLRAITTPRRGVGNATLEKLGAFATGKKQSLFAALFLPGCEACLPAAQLEGLRNFAHFIARLQTRAASEPAGALLRELLGEIDFETWLYDTEDPKPAENKWNSIQELASWFDRRAQENGENLIELTQKIALITLLENREEEDEADVVWLSTLHAAKGLEFNHVCIVGCEEGILPHQQSIDGGQIEEERRLMYVGITRARRSLALSYCARRRRGGEQAVVEPSRFLQELPTDGVRVSGRLRGTPTPVSKTEGRARLANILAGLGDGSPKQLAR